MNRKALDRLERRVTENLQDGDIIFTAIPFILFKQIARGTGSWCSHVGFVVRENDQWMVMESAVPRAKKGTLRAFLAKSCGTKVAVRRLKQPLTTSDVDRLKAAGEKRLGSVYHLGFDFDKPERQYCSRFVREVYSEALGVQLGELETLRELLNNNPQASLLFWRTWYLGFIPWARRTVTPASQLHDPQLQNILHLA